MGLKKKLVIGGVLLVLVCAVAYFAYEHYTYVSTDDAFVEAHTTMLAPRVSGVVNQVLVVENQSVTAGQVLVVLEDKDYRAALANAQATLGALQAQYANAKRDFERSAKLVKKQAISRQAFDHAQAAYLQAERQMKAAQATVDQATLNLEYTRLRAPTNGRIARKSVEVGMYASSGTALMGFVQNDERWVTANYKETDLPSIERGKQANVTVDAIPGRTFKGLVESISPATGATFTLFPPDNATGNFTKVVQRVPVRIHLMDLTDRDMDLLQTGLSANVSVIRHSKPRPVPTRQFIPYLSQQARSLPPHPLTPASPVPEAQAGSAGK